MHDQHSDRDELYRSLSSAVEEVRILTSYERALSYEYTFNLEAGID